ncbi:hypothetical protein [Chitiniphilus eburneus]|uniref:Uncharacterized protein n=1 Tax=Chitiniphilus eburneus TaxID=2571148 RepID=A0A4U0PUA0_9NEIS|nr:hypothetical protein [Chitiniphilus eburneus]TJZ72021.1 hypothetical protein FAZ21_12890 [Chitiniphilus eburneus]
MSNRLKLALCDIKGIVYNLSLPAEAQNHALGEGIPFTEEMALEYERCREYWEDLFADGMLSKEELESLQCLDGKIEKISGEQYERIWLFDELDCPEWNEIRKFAYQMLQRHGWEEGGASGRIYVIGGNK